MPTYPPAPATLSGQLLTIHRMLQSPAVITQRLRTISDLGFVADELLTQRFRTAGGAVSYEVDQPLFTDREVQAVAPGSEYPRALTPQGQAALAAVSKWGQAVRITDERIKRSVPMGNAVDQTLRIVVNTVIQKVDRLAIAAVASSVSQAVEGTNWTNETGSKILLDLEKAKAKISDLEMGYSPNAVLLSTTKYAHLVSDDKIATLRRREATDNPVYGGTIEEIAGLRVLRVPLGYMPGGTDDVWVVDTRMLGGMADEADVDPGYATSDSGVQVQTERIANKDAFDVWARRITVPVVTSPSAAVKITGTSGS